MSTGSALQTGLVSALNFVFGGGLVVAYVAFRKDRRDDKSDQVNVVTQLVTTQLGTSTAISDMQKRISNLFDAGLAARELAATANDRADQLARKLDVVVASVRPVIEWIDAGATPPPPTIDRELRAIVAVDEAPTT